MGREPYYEATPERKYYVLNDKPIETITFETHGARTRITLDAKKWDISEHFADSGSCHTIRLTPKDEWKEWLKTPQGKKRVEQFMRLERERERLK